MTNSLAFLTGKLIDANDAYSNKFLCVLVVLLLICFIAVLFTFPH